MFEQANKQLKALSDSVHTDTIAAGIVPGAVVTLKNGEEHKVTGVSHYISSDKFYLNINTVKRIKSGAWGKRPSGTPLGVIETITPPDADKTYELIMESGGYYIVKNNETTGFCVDLGDTERRWTLFPKDAFNNWCYRRDFRVGDYLCDWASRVATFPRRIKEVREL